MSKKSFINLLPGFIVKPGHVLIVELNKLARRQKSKTYRIVQNPEKELHVVHQVKGPTWEEICYPECYGHSKEMHLTVFSPAEFIFEEKNAIINANSDAVITDKGVYWDKFNQEEFVTWAKPADSNVAWFDRESIGILRENKQQRIEGKVLSLIGLWSYHWAHCLFEFLPKLFSAGEAGLLDSPITILVVENEDGNIKEIINNYLKDFPNAKIYYVQNHIDYICDELYFLPSPGPNYCDYKFRLDYIEYIPQYVIDSIHRYVVAPIIDKIKDNKTKYEKIFMPRNKAFTHTGKYLKNYDEVHDYFMSLGYVDVEGSTMTLEEKADVFYHAKEVVGMFGSALFNLIFCNQAKCISLSNYKFVTETVELIMARNYVSKMVTITGQDDNSDYGSNFYIPLEKIKRAYKDIMLGEVNNKSND